MNEFPVPDTILRDAYLAVARRVKMYRETFISQTENIKEVRKLLGSIPCELSDDDLRDRIIRCAKNPKSHGGGWGATSNGHGPKKGHKGNNRRISAELLRHYESEHYAAVKDESREIHDGHCVACGRAAEEFHHCRYDRIGTPCEIKDVVPVCRGCHNVMDELRRKANR